MLSPAFSLYLAAQILPLTAPWPNASDPAADQYRELREYYERQHTQQQPPAKIGRDGWRKLIGAEYSFLPPAPQFERVSDTADFTVSLATWPLMQVGSSPSTRGSQVARVPLSGFFYRWKEGGPARAAVIAVDGADPAIWLGGGHHVFVPVFARREAFAQPWIEDRQWLDRLATQTGRTLLGAEARQVSAVVDLLSRLPDVNADRIAIAGSHTAIAAAALDDRLGLLGDEPAAAPLWTLPQDLAIWGQARGFAWPAVRKLARSSEVVSGRAVPVPEVAWAKPYNAMFAGWQAYFRNAALEAYARRETQSPVTMDEYLDATGRYPAAEGPLDAQSAQVYDTPDVTGYRVKVRACDGVHATGILLVPKTLDRRSRHPLVFVQHGLAGRPEDALGVEKTSQEPVYRGFGLALARRGYLVFAPMISTQTVVDRNELVRRARPLGLTVAGIERVKNGRMLDFLTALPFVDAARIGFYGLSYGGYTALWTAPGEPRFRAVISSGHFNDWSAKTTDITMGSSYMFYADHLDMFNHGLLTRFGHPELASLIAPRALMIEMGSEDGVMAAPRRLVDAELSRTAAMYRARGAADRFAVARFQGAHRIDGAETFAFLDRFLKQP